MRAAAQAAHLRLPRAADHHDRLVPADRRAARGPRGRGGGRARRGALRATGAAEIERVDPPAGAARAGRAGPRRARAQRHGAVLRRAPRRLRGHPARLGAVVRLALHAAADPARRRARPAPITVRWARYAQSLTAKPVKGMLTGPVTIVAWSFVRDDLPLREVAFQVADAIRDEVRDLEAAGISIIQVDEPALRELMPLRARRAGRLPGVGGRGLPAGHLGGASDRTQIHTHLCYSDADQILAAIDGLDADVTSDRVGPLGRADPRRPRSAASAAGSGPGVYDIHSPRVPSAEEVEGC